MNPKFRPLKPTLSCLLFFALTIGAARAQNAPAHIAFEGSESPDGRFAIAWGIPYRTIDPSGLANDDLDKIENFIIDVQSDTVIATLGTRHFTGANHGSLSISWRNDSLAVFVIENAKWQYHSAVVVYIVAPEKDYERSSDAIPVTIALRRAIRAEIARRHPDRQAVIPGLAISASARQWSGDHKVLLDVTGEVPKLDEFFFEGQVTANLPGPDTVTLGDATPFPPGIPIPADTVTAQDFSISANSAGPIRLGMTLGEAKRALPSADFSRATDGEGIALVAVTAGTQELMRLAAEETDPDSPINDAAPIYFIEVTSPAFKAAGGVSPGMSVKDAEQTLGRLRQIAMSEIESREYATFTNQPSGNFIRLSNIDNSAGNYRSGEMTTTRYQPGATILSIEVTGADIMQDGSIGGIKIGASEAEVYAIAKTQMLGNAFKGKDEIWEAFGQAVQEWIFPDAGLSLHMLSDEIGGPKSVYSITAKAPSKLQTGHGLTIGDSKTAVIESYADYQSDDDANTGFFDSEDTHIVGSVYGGMIFKFKDGRVTEIFLGTAAE